MDSSRGLCRGLPAVGQPRRGVPQLSERWGRSQQPAGKSRLGHLPVTVPPESVAETEKSYEQCDCASQTPQVVGVTIHKMRIMNLRCLSGCKMFLFFFFAGFSFVPAVVIGH